MLVASGRGLWLARGAPTRLVPAIPVLRRLQVFRVDLRSFEGKVCSFDGDRSRHSGCTLHFLPTSAVSITI